MSIGKRVWKFLSSMHFAVILLVILAAACSISSLITQGQSYAWYAQQYSERTAALIIALHLDDAFHSWWFLLLNAFLCLNLLLCNVLRLPQLLKAYRSEADPYSFVNGTGAVSAGPLSDPEAFFRRLRMPAPTRCSTTDGREALYSVKNRAGLWGAWICHLGILLLIAGFSLGQFTQEQDVVYGVAGQSKPVGDTGLILTIDDFRIGLREDDTVEQYTSEITVHDSRSGRSESASVSVNDPASLFGRKFYQNSTGWAELVRVAKNGSPLQEEILCAGEYLPVADKPELVVYFNAFYPDYLLIPGIGPQTRTGQLNNPATLYSVYYQEQLLGMNVLMGEEELTIDEYTVTFSEPQSYTLIQVKRDPFTPLALAGGLIAMIGLILAFYLQSARVWAVRTDQGSWTVSGQSRKGGVLFREQFLLCAQEEQKKEGIPHASD